MQQPQLSLALAALRSHQPVAIPTETVYGLAAPVSDLTALRAVFQIKERPLFNPLIVHISSPEMARKYTTDWPPACEVLAQHFWPGPLTIILPKSPAIHDLITAGHPTVGLRVPNHPLTLELIAALGEGLAAPSANKSTRISPVSHEQVTQQLGEHVPVLDGGECTVGIESTVCEVKGHEVLIYRPGLVGPAEITSQLKAHGLTGYRVLYRHSPTSPGQLATHYRPSRPLVVYGPNTSPEHLREAISQHWPDTPPSQPYACALPSDPYHAARMLYTTLSAPQINQHDLILLYAPMDLTHHAWLAIVDRLRKAATLFVKS